LAVDPTLNKQLMYCCFHRLTDKNRTIECGPAAALALLDSESLHCRHPSDNGSLTGSKGTLIDRPVSHRVRCRCRPLHPTGSRSIGARLLSFGGCWPWVAAGREIGLAAN